MFRNTGVKKYIIIATYSILLFLGVSNIDKVWQAVQFVFGLLTPIIIGLCIAFVLNLLMKFYENRVLKKMGTKHSRLLRFKRLASMLLTYLSVVAFLTGILFFIIPQISKSASTFIVNAPGYISNFQEWTQELAVKFNLSSDAWEQVLKNWEQISAAFTTFLSDSMMNVLNFTLSFTSSVFNFFLGLIFSIYMLYSKEKLLGILKKMVYAFAKPHYSRKIVEISAQTNEVFGRFIGGQLTEAFILGFLCFIGASILRIPYAPLVAVLMGVTSVLPIVGAYIGTITSGLIILMEDPFKALIFVIFILCLQQFEGNVIYPKVVGSAIGLNGFWVFSAIIIGGGLFGVMGILISVPLTALIYTLMRTFVHKRLRENGLPELVTVGAPPGVKEAEKARQEAKQRKKENKKQKHHLEPEDETGEDK